MHEYLISYDYVLRRWEPRAASYEITADENAGTLTMTFTLRNDLYWSYYDSDRKVKVTSDDVVFWYNEVMGDRSVGSSGYNRQFLSLADGTQAHVDIHKIDERRFSFLFPRIIAEPEVATNFQFGPRHIYEPAKARGGAQALRDLFNVATDPKTIPSVGELFLVEYTPGLRLVYKRNPDYWRKDAKGVSIPYYEEKITLIIPDHNTQLLMFRAGQIDSCMLNPDDLEVFVNQNNGSYSVFYAEGTPGAPLWTFNQNPVNKGTPQYEWFTQKEFRQAMSCLLNRVRINVQAYRGLADPKISIFPDSNPYYNPAITMPYLYNPQRAKTLLASIGIKPDSGGIMRYKDNRAIEFNLSVQAENQIHNDIAMIISDELSKVGIKANISPVDFQLQADQMLKTFDWDSTIVHLSSANIFPGQGSDIWLSSGNLHVWYPRQTEPATEWEARIDHLHSEGRYTVDTGKAWKIWDEFQSTLLEECPLIYLLSNRSFWALQNRWDFTNVYFDNKNGYETSFVYLKQ
jgi:peptide/nickel transport system substrate-binding protein